MKTSTSRKLGSNRNEVARKNRRHDSNFSQSRDIREDRGARQGKLAQEPHSTLPHGQRTDLARKRGILLPEHVLGSKRPVQIRLQNEDAKTVTVAGTFNGWHPESIPLQRVHKAEWTTEIALEAGSYQYRFIVDGQWTNDPDAAQSVPNGFGEENSVLNVS